jgi:hypothetical protein
VRKSLENQRESNKGIDKESDGKQNQPLEAFSFVSGVKEAAVTFINVIIPSVFPTSR